MVIRHQNPKFLIFFKKLEIFKNVLVIRFQRALNDFPILLQTQVMRIFVLWAQMPKYGNSTPEPQIFDFFKKLENFKNVLVIRFQQALNHYQKLF